MRIKNLGDINATIIATLFVGKCGGCGCDDGYTEGNILILEAQGPDTKYQFNDDGSVDVYYEDDEEKEYVKEFLIGDCDMEEEEAEEIVENPKHWDSVYDLINDDEETWFCDVWEESKLLLPYFEAQKKWLQKGERE